MAIARVGASQASANSVASVTGSAGDIIIAWAYRSANATAPSAASGWTTIGTAGGSTNSYRCSYIFCTSSAAVTPTFTNADRLVLVRYSGVYGIGASSFAAIASSNSMSYPALTLIQGSSTDWVVGVGAHRTATDVNTAPTGMSTITSGSAGSGPMACVFDTNGTVSSWSAQTVTVNATSGRCSGTIELLGAKSTLNPYTKSTLWTLSSSNMVGTQTSATGADSSVQATLPRASGKYYFTMTVGASVNGEVGITQINTAVTDYPDVTGAALTDSGNILISSSLVGTITGGFSATNVIHVAVDYTGKLIWWAVGSGNWNDNPSANPATGANGYSISGLTGSIVPALGGSGGSTGFSFTYDPQATSRLPSGFDPWDGATSSGVTVNVTTVQGVGQVGTATVEAKAVVSPTGVQGIGLVGTPTVQLVLNVPVTTVLGVGYVGTSTVVAKANTTVTGVQGIGEVGTVTVTTGGTSVNVNVTGVEALGYVGNVTVAAKAVTTVTGVQGIGLVGTATVQAKAQVGVTGVQGVGYVGTVSVTGKARVTVTGVQGVGYVGTVSVGRVEVNVTGVQGIGRVGTVTAKSGVTVHVTGVQGVGYVGTTTLWSVIDDNQTPNWQNVATAQSPDWQAVDDTNSTIWSEIPT